MKRATNKLYWDYNGKSTDGTARKREEGWTKGRKRGGKPEETDTVNSILS